MNTTVSPAGSAAEPAQGQFSPPAAGQEQVQARRSRPELTARREPHTKAAARRIPGTGAFRFDFEDTQGRS